MYLRNAKTNVWRCAKKKVFHLTDTEYEKFIYQLNARNSSEFFRKLFKAIFRAQCKYYIHIHTCTLRGAAVLKLELIKFTQNWLLVSGKFPRLLLIFAQYPWNQKYKNTLEYSILSILSICAFAWIYDPINALTPAWKMPNNRNEDPREGGQRSHHAKTFYQRFAKCVLFLDQLADCISLGSIAVVVVVVSRVCGENSNN